MFFRSALKRVLKSEQDSAQLDVKAAQKIAANWQSIVQCEDALCILETGLCAWRAAPAVQLAMAASVSDLLKPNDAVTTLGFQAYPWVRAAGVTSVDVACIQLGKALPQNVYASTADDIALSFKTGEFTLVAVHVESAAGWQDVRTITAAAVKKEAPMLMVVSAGVDAPQGVIIETMENWAEAAYELRAAMVSVREQKAIRVLAVADMDSASLEMAMMEAANMTPEQWAQMLQKNSDEAEKAMNQAYLAPVTSF
jgi:hypothetical protein